MAPQLALAYSSGGGNGPAGVGWSVSGASSWIVRCGKSMLVDGSVSAVRSDAGDRFCLDGQELVAVGAAEIGSSGAYGELGTGYRTQTDNFASIVSSGSTGPSGPDFFSVATIHPGRRPR
jgi:hypothetical protein